MSVQNGTNMFHSQIQQFHFSPRSLLLSNLAASFNWYSHPPQWRHLTRNHCSRLHHLIHLSKHGAEKKPKAPEAASGEVEAPQKQISRQKWPTLVPNNMWFHPYIHHHPPWCLGGDHPMLSAVISDRPGRPPKGIIVSSMPNLSR